MSLEHRQPTQAPTLVVLGDSIVYGWGVAKRESYAHLLQEMLAQDARLSHWRVIAAGVPGDTTLMGVDRFESDVVAHQPDAVLIAFGLNDGALSRSVMDQQRERAFWARTQPWWRAWFILRRIMRQALARRPMRPSHRATVVHQAEPRVRPAVFAAGLRCLIRQSHEIGARPLLLSLMPLDDTRLDAEQRQTYQAYAAVIRRTAEATHTRCIVIEHAEHVPGHYAPDGIHLLPAGHRWLAEQVFVQVAPILEHHEP